MKKVIFIFTVLTLLLALVACGGTSSSGSTTSDSTTNDSTSGTTSATDNSSALSLEMQLLIGTIKLEDTDLAVSADQAAQLLPLWQAYKELTASDTSAQAEIDAVVAQIQSTMNPQQTQAITDMNLTLQDEFTLMQELGLTANRSNASGTPGAPSGQGPQFFGPEAGGGQGGYPGAGGGQEFNPQQMATAQAGRAQSGEAGNRVLTPLLNALIDLLQKRAQP